MNDCLIITGEKSGEEHCLSFLPSLQKKVPYMSFFGVGGDEMEALGVELVYHLNDFSSFGFSEVIHKIPFYINAEKQILAEVKRRKCKYAILVDYQGFNLKLAKKLKVLGVEIFYYVAPQAWAWKEWRVKTIESCVHTLFTIIPFEKKWFMERGVQRITSVPHPVFVKSKEEVKTLKPKKFKYEDDFLELLLLPGSRNFEVKFLLPVFMEVVREIRKTKKIRLSIVCSNSVKEELYKPYEADFDKIYQNEELTSALINADFSIASSGTVTLSLALFGVPSVVAYKGSLLNAYIFDQFLKYDHYISLGNLVHQQALFPEFIQNEASVFNIVQSSLQIINDESKYTKLANTLVKTRDLLSGDDNDVADIIASAMGDN